MEKKQIEEMAKDLSKHSFFYNGGCLMNYSNTAKLLYEAGYRKASDVAREIFAEIERIAMSKIDTDLSIAALTDTYYIEAIDELKKKYESEGGE